MQPAGGQPSSSDLARKILTACGLVVDDLQPLASGAQSVVWSIDARQGRFVLRIAAPRAGERTRYEAEFAIRTRLREQGRPVSRPIATNEDVDAGVAVDWCLDEFVVGNPVRDAPLPRQACHDLGALLAALHALPVAGHGFLENRRDQLVGERRSARQGICARLERPWPFTGDPLERHPIAAEAPELVARLRALEPALLELIHDERKVAAIHTDLHAGQLPVSNNQLTALLDFGDAVVAPPAWDIGSFGYFHGWGQAGLLLEGYGSDPATRAELLEQGRLFAIVIALHHAGRAVTLNAPERMHGALRYLRANF